MKTKLVVTLPFSKRFAADEPKREFAKGDFITETAEMKAVRETHKAHVVAIAAEPPEGDAEHAAAKASEKATPLTQPDRASDKS